MPLSDLEVVSKELLESKDLTVLQLCLLETTLPLLHDLVPVLLGECTGNGDIASCQEHISLNSVVLVSKHTSNHNPLLFLRVKATKEGVCSSLPEDCVVNLNLQLVDGSLLGGLMCLVSLQSLVNLLDFKTLRLQFVCVFLPLVFSKD